MIKKISAILLVFALLAGFSACRRLEGNEFNKQENAFVVNDEGVTQQLATRVNEEGKTEYYYTDSNGNEIVVDKNNVKVETTYVPVQTTLSDKEIDKIIEDGDLEKLEDAVTEDIAEPEFEMSDGIISEETFEKVEVELDNEGKPIHGAASSKTMGEILKSGTFTIDFTVKAKVDGVETILPIKMMKDGNNMYMETIYPISATGKIRTNLIANDDGFFLVIPVLNAYLKMPSEEMEGAGSMGDIFEGYDFTNIEDDIKMNDGYESSGKVTVNGQTYDCDIFKGEDGATVKYYYLNNELKRIENTSDAGEIITEFKEISGKVDKSKFKTPKGRDLAKMAESLSALEGLTLTTAKQQ